MKERNPLVVFLLSIITVGIYYWYWLVKTKGEMNRTADAGIMTAWIWLIPFIGGLWWLWQYSVGVEKVTNGKYSSALAFIILLLIPGVGIEAAIIQHAFNEAGSQSSQPPTQNDSTLQPEDTTAESSQ